jgi:hypothetical protein
MLIMLTRRGLSLLVGLVLSLFITNLAAAQQGTAPRTQTTQAKPATTPGATQPQNSGATAKPKETKGTWQLKISKSQPPLVSLKAEQVPASEIAGELHRRLNVPVLLSPVMEKARITLEFSATPLEGALRMIAPQPYVDYELTGDGAAPKLVAIYLYALNEPPPSDTAVVTGTSQALLIEGNTEDGVDGNTDKEAQEKTLSVKFERNQVTLHAHRQPLTVVLGELANKVDIPFEMPYDSTELVDVDLSNATMEQAVRALSPNIHLYQRTDLQTYETRPLRIVLAPPTNTQPTNKM